MKTILINGVNFTSYFMPSGFVCSYDKIEGQNSGVMKNGDRVQDIIAIKAKGQAKCMPLNELQQAKLLAAIYESQPVALQYFDARTGANRSIKAYMEASKSTYRGYGGTGVEFWTGLVVSFSEV